MIKLAVLWQFNDCWNARIHAGREKCLNIFQSLIWRTRSEAAHRLTCISFKPESNIIVNRRGNITKREKKKSENQPPLTVHPVVLLLHLLVTHWNMSLFWLSTPKLVWQSLSSMLLSRAICALISGLTDFEVMWAQNSRSHFKGINDANHWD